MKAISLLQPWAMLVILGAKRFETRTWQTPYRGPLVIHASRRFPEELRELCRLEPFRGILRQAGFVSWFDLPVQVILGTVEIVDCQRTESLTEIDAQERALGDYRAGRWAWQLERPRPLSQPIPWKGLPGLYTIPDALFRADVVEVRS